MACSASAFRGVEDDVVEELGVEPGFEDMCGDAEDRVVEPGAEGDVGDLGVEPGLEDICGDADERVVKPGDGVGDLGVEPGLEDLCDDAEDRVVKPGVEDDAGDDVEDLGVEPGLEDEGLAGKVSVSFGMQAPKAMSSMRATASELRTSATFANMCGDAEDRVVNAGSKMRRLK